MLYLFGLIIIPLLIMGVILISIVYQQELELNTERYQEKLEWISEQVENAFLDGENFALTMYLDRNAQNLLKETKSSQSSNEISILMNEQTRNKDWYKSICVTVDGEIMKQWSGGVILSRDKEEYVNQTYEIEGNGFWTEPRYLENTVLDNSEKAGKVLTYYGKIFDYSRYQNVLGVVSISISEDYICQLYQGSLSELEGTHMLIAPGGKIISATDKELLGTTYEEYDRIKDDVVGDQGHLTISVHNRNYIVLYQKSESYDWYLTSVIPESQFLNSSMISLVIIIICIALCILFGIIFGMIMKRSLLNPLRVLADTMANKHTIDSEKMENQYKKNEIGILYKAFSQMETNLDNMIQKNYISEICRKEAELQTLFSQINPHFLYNTMDSIYWLAIQNKDYEVADQISKFSDIFRHSLSVGNEMVSISSEIEFIRKYVDIMKIQTSNPIILEVEIDEELQKKRIPRLLLQPLVENIFTHGICEQKREGWILLSAEVTDGKLCIMVTDNGVGTDENEIRKELENPRLSKKAFALKNVDKRIRLIYGEAYGLEFHSNYGEGTTVIIILPENTEVDEAEKYYENDDN